MIQRVSLEGIIELGTWVCREYAKVYVEDENEAKRDHKGIWQGDFQKPADWRKENKAKGGSKSSNNSEPTGKQFLDPPNKARCFKIVSTALEGFCFQA